MSTRWNATLLSSALILCLGCHAEESRESLQNASASEAMASPEATPDAAPAPAAPVTGMIHGTVTETMDAGGYTYVRVDTGSGLVWAAGPQLALAVGATVGFDSSMPMANYTSQTLGRTFDRVYFAGEIKLIAAAQGEVAKPSAPMAPAEGGVTVEQVFAEREALVGTELVLRGEVVKFNAGIMGTNWLHLQDGTGAEGTNDLTITTDATVAVGDTITARGVLAADRDFGYGYVYDLIIEGATISVE